jgi:hypothetical protein
VPDNSPEPRGGPLGRVVSFVAAAQAINTNTHRNEAPIANVGSVIATSPSDTHPTRAIETQEVLTPALSDPRGGVSDARMACLAAIVVGLVAVPTHRLAVLLAAWLTAEPQETALREPTSEGSASMIVIRVPAAAVAMPDTSDLDSLAAPMVMGAALAPDFAEPSSPPSPQASTATAHRKFVAKARAVGIQRPSGHAPGGTWLFQANLTGGGSG